jgi:hypothetical protein
LEELRSLREEMAAMREAGRRDLVTGDVSENEQEDEHEPEEITDENIGLKLLREVIGASLKPRLEVNACDGGLNPEELLTG